MKHILIIDACTNYTQLEDELVSEILVSFASSGLGKVFLHQVGADVSSGQGYVRKGSLFFGDNKEIFDQDVYSDILEIDEIILLSPTFNLSSLTSFQYWLEQVLLGQMKSIENKDTGISVFDNKRFCVIVIGENSSQKGAFLAFQLQEENMRHVLGLAGIRKIEFLNQHGLARNANAIVDRFNQLNIADTK